MLLLYHESTPSAILPFERYGGLSDGVIHRLFRPFRPASCTGQCNRLFKIFVFMQSDYNWAMMCADISRIPKTLDAFRASGVEQLHLDNKTYR
jgi:hypothetical protein